MIVIADSNIIFSALISPKGNIASILKETSNIQFIAPDYLLDEVYEHWETIVKFTTLSKKDLFEEFYFYKERVTFTHIKDIPKIYRTKAYNLVKDIDDDDANFVAMHLHRKHKLWTGDKKLIKGLKEKGYDICITTSELKEKLYKKRRRSGALPLLAVLLAMLLV